MRSQPNAKGEFRSGADVQTTSDKLADLLAEFARTLLTDFPIQTILDRLVTGIVDALPVSAAGVTLMSETSAPHFIAASNDSALAFERLQTNLGQGPCRLAYESGEPVQSPDLTVETRFSTFTAAALGEGLKAAFAFPLRHNDGRLGALDLYRDSTGPLSRRDVATARTLADVTAAYVLNAQARDRLQETSDRFRDSALRDPLTGLANRSLLHQRLEHAAARGHRSHRPAAVLFADLDRFKHVNDTYGHQIGDELLVAVARRLTELVRSGDTLARVSGDEFVFLCEDLANADDIEILASRIASAMREPFDLSGQKISISASVGMAFAGPGEQVTNQLVVDADVAMYQAKRRGGAKHQILDLREAQETSERNLLEQDLYTAFAERTLDVVYQPIVEGNHGRVIGAEALLRWTHPTRGPIPALDAIGIAEENGLILEIGLWVMERACTDYLSWLRNRPERRLEVAVNVSARQLMSAGFLAAVDDILTRTDMPPEKLTLEMTEGIFIGDSDRALTVLADLKQLGVRLALDDFGTGYCSLNYLRQFPVDILKVDRAFIETVGQQATATAIVASITHLAHLFGMTVVAEGVETSAQREEILAMGCDLAQGYFYARPMSSAAMDELLRSSADDVVLPALDAGSRRQFALNR
jgi:diguanylate cyclase (GGDEF)-like protein